MDIHNILSQIEPNEIQAGEVHIWWSRLSNNSIAVDNADLKDYFLSVEEEDRAASMGNAVARQRFICGRRLLRLILAHYTGLEPNQLHLELGEHGKPMLKSFEGVRPLQFSLSHSGELIAAAVTAQGQIGLDIEGGRRQKSIGKIVENFFHPDEKVVFHKTATTQQEEQFYRYWTLKEATVKAMGKTIAGNISNINLEQMGDDFSIRSIRDTKTWPPQKWLLKSAILCPGIVISVALFDVSKWKPDGLNLKIFELGTL